MLFNSPYSCLVVEDSPYRQSKVITMGLTNKKEEQLKKMPLVESRFSKSKDGRYVVHKTIITTIRPVSYFEKVIESEGTVESSEVESVLGSELVS